MERVVAGLPHLVYQIDVLLRIEFYELLLVLDVGLFLEDGGDLLELLAFDCE